MNPLPLKEQTKVLNPLCLCSHTQAEMGARSMYFPFCTAWFAVSPACILSFPSYLGGAVVVSKQKEAPKMGAHQSDCTACPVNGALHTNEGLQRLPAQLSWLCAQGLFLCVYDLHFSLVRYNIFFCLQL